MQSSTQQRCFLPRIGRTTHVGCLLLSLLALMAVAPATHAQFRDPLVTPAVQVGDMAARSRLLAVAAAGSRLVAVGPRGHIVVSDDDGGTWTQVDVPVSTDLVALTFVDDTHGWASGHDGVILHTADAGSTWQLQLDGHRVLAQLNEWFGARLGAAGDTPPPAVIDDGSMDDDVDSDVDAEDAPAPTMNLEEARGLLTEGIDKPFFDIAFVSRTEGYAVGAYSLAFRTRDGGATWEPMIDAVDNPRLLHLYGLATSGDAVYLVGEQGLVTRLDRATQRFTALPSPSAGSYFGVLANGDSVLAYGLAGAAFRSADRGETWQALDTGGNDAIVAGTSLADGRTVLVTPAGRVLATDADSSTLTRVATDKAMPWFDVASDGRGKLALVGSAGVAVESLAPAN